MMVLHLFVWAHALGSRALLLPPAIQNDALIAVSSLQIICYSVRGLRPFTEVEHRFVFKEVGREFWRALTNIVHFRRQSRIVAAESYNEDRSPSKRRRVPHWRTAEQLDAESSDTASSTDGNMPPYFLRSDKIVPHSFVHFPEQVILGGTHRFHDVSLQESTHRRNIGRAGARSRTYHDVNATSTSMLKFLNEYHLLEEICFQAHIDSDEGYVTHSIYEGYVTHSTPPTVYGYVTHSIYEGYVTHSTPPTVYLPQFILWMTYPQYTSHHIPPTVYLPQYITHSI